MRNKLKRALFLAIPFFCYPALAIDSQSLEKTYAQEAKVTPSISRGLEFFTSKHGQEWSCATCHSTPPNKETRHIVTDKVIAPLAPAANPRRFTDQAKVDKWFKRNCKDVLDRECTSAEKADVLAYLNSIR